MSRRTVRVLVAEDEPAQRRQLVDLIKACWPEAVLVAECNDGDAAMAALERELPEVLFLDIRMPGASGLEVARAASGRAHVVLTTAYEEYAIRAFEAGAMDYLLKPVTSQRLQATVQRLTERLTETPPRIEALLDALDRRLLGEPREQLKWISASVGDNIRLVAVDDVLFFRACEKYVRVVTADDEALVRMSLKELETRLDPEHFWRIHRSVLVAASAVASVEKNELGQWHARLRRHEEILPVNDSARARFRGL